jgi:D-beta-D-heptose 7-phosphate kinase/D-beta-D-heptose 1-phosphate adenosyltransferase
LVPEDERAELVAALESVDFVTIFDSPTASDVIAEVQPAVYVKGGDYSANALDGNFPPEGHAVLAYGGTVVTVPHLAGHSTSGLLHDIAALPRMQS